MTIVLERVVKTKVKRRIWVQEESTGVRRPEKGNGFFINFFFELRKVYGVS